MSFERRHVGIRDYIEVVQKPNEPFTIVGELTLKPFCLGTARLARVPAGPCPSDLAMHLGKFQNYSWWDPELPQVQEIARGVKGRTCAETVQNILDWFHRNIRYDATIRDDPKLGQLGTILKLRYGGCHHNSGLFVILCRAAGVPACVAHGNALPADTKPFHIQSSVGHGWAEVYINTIGWVPVEPTNPDSLRMFTADQTYMTVGASNRPPEAHHFASTIRYEGVDYPLASIQGCEVKGQLVQTRMPQAGSAAGRRRS